MCALLLSAFGCEEQGSAIDGVEAIELAAGVQGAWYLSSRSHSDCGYDVAFNPLVGMSEWRAAEREVSIALGDASIEPITVEAVDGHTLMAWESTRVLGCKLEADTTLQINALEDDRMQGSYEIVYRRGTGAACTALAKPWDAPESCINTIDWVANRMGELQ